jgi:hypothetical protein
VEKTHPKEMRATSVIFRKLTKKNKQTQQAKNSQTWDRCYDFLNIFSEKFGENFGEKISVFCSS